MRATRCLGASTLALVASGFPVAAMTDRPPLDEAEFYLVQPLLGKVPLTDAITVAPIEEGALVPLGDICRLLAFGIVVDASKGRAEGFFISEKRRFSLDLNAGFVDTDGQHLPIPEGSAVRQGQEIFVDAKLLEEWFPLQVKVDLKSAVLLIKSKEKLPIQEQWEREGKYTSGVLSMSGQSPDDQPVGEYLKIPYSLVGPLCANLNFSWNKSQHSSSGSQPAVSAFLAGDFLGMSAIFTANRDQDGHVDNASWTLFREDPHAGLLGPLHAKTIEIGNIQQPPSLGVANSLPVGRGVLVDNYPLGYRSRFATRSFTGFLEDGWSVELYQNGSLVGFQKSRADGQFEFRDIPLRFGTNQFKLVFRGPFGQVREETSRYDIASDQPKPGELFYRVTFERPLRSDSTLAQTDPAAIEEAESKTDGLAQMEYGLSKFLAMNAGTARVAHPDGYFHTYADIGVRAFLPYLSIQVDVAQDRTPSNTPGRAIEEILQTGYNYSTFSVQRKDFRDGFQEMDNFHTGIITQDLASETQVQWDWTPSWKQRSISFSLSHDIKTYLDGDRVTKDMVKSTLAYPSFTITPMLTRTHDSSLSGPATVDGNLFVTGSRGAYSYQGEVSASRTGSGTRLTGWSILQDYTSAANIVYRLGLKGTNSTLSDATLVTGVSRFSGKYGYGVDLQYSKQAGYTINLRAQVSFAREPRTGKWVSDAKPTAGLGALSAIAFKDDNGNKRLDPGEQIQKETKFKVGNQTVENAIKDPFVVFKTGLPRSQDTILQVDETSLEDPALQATVKAYRIVPRPGKVAKVEFPIAAFGEIDGTTRIRRGQGPEEFGGLELELLKADGERFRILRSAYDGYFEIRDLPLGDYLLRVSPADAARLKLKDPPVRKFHIDAVKNLFEGQDMVVEPSEAPEIKPEALPVPAPPLSSPPLVPPVEEKKPVPDDPASSSANPVPSSQLPAAAPLPSSAPTCLDALRQGDLRRAIALSEIYRIGQPAGSWTICLESVHQVRTLYNAAALFPGSRPDLWIRPVRRADGGNVYLVLLGAYPSRAQAELKYREIPKAFFADGNRPQIMASSKLRRDKETLSGDSPSSISTPLPSGQLRAAATLPSSDSALARLEALRRGDLRQAIALSRSYHASQPVNAWTICIGSARRAQTLGRAAALFHGSRPDLWTLPIRRSSGGYVYLMFLGVYPSRAEAEQKLREIPRAFFASGKRPQIMASSQLHRSNRQAEPL